MITFTKKQLKEFGDLMYWIGFNSGRNNSLKHNINLMKGQLVKQKEKKQRSKGR